ncbi:MAG TPA: type II secretion system protein [Verrucomicrobiae bacterium]
MRLRLEKTGSHGRKTGFTLVELLVAFSIFAMVSSGVIYGYIQINRMSEWSAISLAAQSYASQGAEQVRAADWRPHDYPPATGFGTMDEMPAPYSAVTNYILDIPIKGNPASNDFAFFVTNYVSISDVSVNPPLRQIRSDAVWTFYLTGKKYTNTVILLRAPDQ